MDRDIKAEIYRFIQDDEEMRNCYMADPLFHAVIQNINDPLNGMGMTESFVKGLKAVCDSRKGLFDSFVECQNHCVRPNVIQIK